MIAGIVALAALVGVRADVARLDADEVFEVEALRIIASGTPTADFDADHNAQASLSPSAR